MVYCCTNGHSVTTTRMTAIMCRIGRFWVRSCYIWFTTLKMDELLLISIITRRNLSLGWIHEDNRCSLMNEVLVCYNPSSNMINPVNTLTKIEDFINLKPDKKCDDVETDLKTINFKNQKYFYSIEETTSRIREEFRLNYVRHLIADSFADIFLSFVSLEQNGTNITNLSVLYVFYALTGRISDNGVVNLGYTIKQTFLLNHQTDTHLNPLCIIDEFNQVHIYPEDAKYLVVKLCCRQGV